MRVRPTHREGSPPPALLPGFLAIAAAVLAGCSAQPPATPAGPDPEAVPSQAAGEAPVAGTDEATAEAESPERTWMVDADGRSYYVERVERYEGAYEWVDEDTVRYLGVQLDVVDHDDEYFYVRSYRTEEGPSGPPPAPTAEEIAAVEATYATDVATVDRLQFLPFDRGLPSRGQWRNGFELADMNGDGHLDIVHGPARKGSGVPAIFLGDGAGNWRIWREARFPTSYDYGDVAVADFNGDGHLDLALGIHLRGLRVLVGDGAGTFTEWSQGIDYEIPGRGGDASVFSSRAVTAVDWDGDGRQDVLAVGEGPRPTGSQKPASGGFGAAGMGAVAFVADSPAVFLNQGDGSWKKIDRGTDMNQIFGDGVALGDFNGDGRVDFATASSRMGRRDLVNLGATGENDGVTWEPMPVPQVRPMAYVRSVVGDDFDGDGVDDLVVAFLAYEVGSWRNGIDVLYARPGGGWERRTVFAREGREAIYALGHGDLDGDGALDLVGVDAEGGVLVFLGDGEGFFAREESPELDQPQGRCRGYHVDLADLDGDGRDEVVAAFADEASAYFDPTRCPSSGGISAWKARPAP